MDKFKIYITDSLEKYDKNKETYGKIFRNVESYKYVLTENELENDKLVFFDKNNKKIIEADFEYIGAYFVAQNIWIWGWAIHRLKKKWISKSKKMLQYGLSLDEEENSHLKLELINSRFMISDPIQIDIHLAVASELSKVPCIYQIVRSINFYEELFFDVNNDPVIKIPKNIDMTKVQLHYLFLYNIKEF